MIVCNIAVYLCCDSGYTEHFTPSLELVQVSDNEMKVVYKEDCICSVGFIN